MAQLTSSLRKRTPDLRLKPETKLLLPAWLCFNSLWWGFWLFFILPVENYLWLKWLNGGVIYIIPVCSLAVLSPPLQPHFMIYCRSCFCFERNNFEPLKTELDSRMVELICWVLFTSPALKSLIGNMWEWNAYEWTLWKYQATSRF